MILAYMPVSGGLWNFLSKWYNNNIQEWTFIFSKYFLHHDTVIIFGLDSKKMYPGEGISWDFK